MPMLLSVHDTNIIIIIIIIMFSDTSTKFSFLERISATYSEGLD
jgi:hypothetical protein